MQSEGLTQRDAARELGVSQPAVSKMLKAGKLRRLASGRIDPASIDEMRPIAGERKHDSGSGGRAEPAAIGAPQDAGSMPGAEPAQVALPTEWGGLTYAEARRLKEANVAWMRNLEAQEKVGQLVDRDAVRAEWESIALHLRERMMALPARVATRLGLTPDQKDIIDAAVREALNAIDPGDSRH